MTKRKRDKRKSPSGGPPKSQRAAGFSLRDAAANHPSNTTDLWALVLFAVLLVIVGLRPLIQETHDTERMPLSSVLSELPDVGPLPTLWIDLVLVGVFGFTLALRSQGRLPRPRRSGIMLGFVMLALAASASCFVASNKRLAINTTLDWITLPMLAIALAYLLQHAWQMRLMLCVIVASGAASAVVAYDQAFVTLPQTVELYEQEKDRIWQQRGLAPDSYQIKLFENRVYEQAANGFFSMGNIAGSYFVLPIFAALALACASWRAGARLAGHPVRGSARAEVEDPDSIGARGSLGMEIDARWFAVAIVLLAVGMVGAVVCTKSRGALLALLLGLLLCGLLWVGRRFIAANRRRAFLLGWAVVAGGLACVAGYGLVQGKLPGGSLTYRWWYLETTAKMVADHPVFGVGSGQYSRYYPQYKEIKSPEEIANPHNFLAHAAAEWGVGGLLGMIFMLVGGSRGASGLRNSDCGLRNEEVFRVPARGDSDIRRPMLWGAVLFLGVWGLQIWLVGHDSNYVYAHLAFPMLGWVSVFAICVASGFASGNSIKATAFPITPAGILGVGLFAFLIHNLITFSLFVPGAATTFFAMLGVCIAMRCNESLVGGAHPTPSPARLDVHSLPKRSWLVTPAGFLTTLAMALMYVFAIQPVGRCWQHLLTARAQVLPNQSPFQAYTAAVLEDPLDPTPGKEWTDLRVSHPRLMLVGPSYHGTGLARDPRSVSALRSRAREALALRELEAEWASPLRLAGIYYEKVLELYPTSPDDHLMMGEIQIMLHRAEGAAEALERAIVELKIALDLNSQRDVNEVRRFSTEKVADIEAKLERLRKLRNEPRGQ